MADLIVHLVHEYMNYEGGHVTGIYSNAEAAQAHKDYNDDPENWCCDYTVITTSTIQDRFLSDIDMAELKAAANWKNDDTPNTIAEILGEI